MSESNTEFLPPEFKFGYVYTRVLRAIGDTKKDDDRFPDGLPAEGTVTFRPKRALKEVASDGSGYKITREPITCTIYDGKDDPEKAGELVDEAGHIGGVWLPVGEWTAEYRFTDRYSTIPNDTFILTDEYTVDDHYDLVLQAGIEPSPTEKFVVNEQIYLDSKRYRDEGKDFRDQSKDYRDEAQTSATSSADSASDSKDEADRAEAAANSLQIDIDTSAGTKVTVGGVVVSYDSGARDISSNVLDGWTVRANGLTVHRKNSQVVAVIDVSRNEDGGSFANIFDPPQGFKPAVRARILPAFISTSKQGWIDSIADTIRIRDLSASLSEGDRLTMTVTWQTDDPYPSTLPGTPA